MNIELYIENEKVDLTDKISFPLNKKWDNLNNPTDIINDYSKVIEIPRTKHNDNLFGNIFKLDKYTAVSNILGTPSHKESGTYSNFNWTVTNASVNKLQLGVIDTENYDNWTYVYKKSFTSNFGTEVFEFTYDVNTMHRLEFSLRDTYDNEYSWLQFNITSGLTDGVTYQCHFTYSISGGVTKISNISLSKKDNNKYIYFNPAKKANFKLIYNGDLLMEGYCKMNTISNSVNDKNYEINLFGQLGELFQTMKDITFNKDSATDQKYVVADHFNPVLVNRWSVKGSWENPQGSLDISSTNYNDWIGWMPCNRGLYDNFDSSVFETNAGVTCDFVSTLEKKDGDGNINGFSEADAQTIVGDGISEACLREYRSYYQKPYVYCNKLVQLLKEKFEEIKPEYKLNLDSSFFHINNPYWTDLVMGCDYADTKDSELFSNYYKSDMNNGTDTLYDLYKGFIYIIGTSRYFHRTLIVEDYKYNDKLDFTNSYAGNEAYIDLTETIQIEDVPILSGDNITFKIETGDTIAVSFNGSGMYLYLGEYKGAGTTYKYNASIYHCNALHIRLDAVDEDGNILQKGIEKLIGSNNSDYDIDVNIGYANTSYGGAFDSYFPVLYDGTDYYFFNLFKLDGITFSTTIKNTKTFKLRLKVWWDNDGPNISHNKNGKGNVYRAPFAWLRFRNWVNNSSEELPEANSLSVLCSQSNRTDKEMSLGDILGEDFNLFEFFVKYCKMFGLVIDYDNVNKIINVMTRNEYFKNYSISDWSNKVDRNQDFQITPVWFEHKYELFDYEDTEGAYYDEYRDKYGIGYGGKRINTGYDFNNDSDDLMKDGFTSTILSQEHNLDWNNLYDNAGKNFSLTKYKSKEVLPAFYKIDGNSKEDISVTGNFMFRKSENLGFDESLRRPIISDDTPNQIIASEYHWTQNEAYYVKVDERPNIDVEDNGYGCLWHRASQAYYNYVANDSIYIYDCAWNAYISDRYSTNNRKVTAYFNLTPTDYMQFKFYKFIKLDDCVYVVNQIYDYDVNSNNTTKVELIQVADISKYTNGQLYAEEPHWLKAYGKDVPNRGNKALYFDATGGTQMLYIELSDNNKPISISKPSWVSFIGVPIVQDGKITYRCRVRAYTGKQGRKATLKVNGAIDSDGVLIVQNACYISADKTFAKITEGENLEIKITTNVPQSGITWVMRQGTDFIGEWLEQKTGSGPRHINENRDINSTITPSSESESGTTRVVTTTTSKRSEGVYTFLMSKKPNGVYLPAGQMQQVHIIFTTSCGASCKVIVNVNAKDNEVEEPEIIHLTGSSTAVTTTSIVAPNLWQFKDPYGELKYNTILASGLTATISTINNGKQTITITADDTYVSTGATTYTIPIVRPITLTERANINKQLTTTTGKLKVGNKIGKVKQTVQDTVVITVS